MVTQTTMGQQEGPLTEQQIHNICKRIDEGKATEEEVCALRDLALTAIRAPVSAMAEKFDCRWIDASVRVPEDNSPVLVYQGDASHTKRTASYFFKRWSWTDISYDHPCKPEVWMPIPRYEAPTDGGGQKP